jgi:N-acetylmuramic acid 6-phosphate etherase
MTIEVSDTANLLTESASQLFAVMDELPTIERLRLMNAEDKKVAMAVELELNAIAAGVSLIVESFNSGGRLIYIGAGTSGRLGVLDASECPPTFGTEPGMVEAIMAGGPGAVFKSIEGAEDSAEGGIEAMTNAKITTRDTVVGISASGRSPYVIGAITEALRRGASTIAVANNRPCQLEGLVDVTIAPVVGPEVIAGSTRLKAGTAQKMVLNLLSTNAMVEIGKVYGNRMVDLRATNLKLRDRAQRMTIDITGSPAEEVREALNEADGSVKLAILMLERRLTAGDAASLLEASGGFLRKALSA